MGEWAGGHLMLAVCGYVYSQTYFWVLWSYVNLFPFSFLYRFCVRTLNDFVREHLIRVKAESRKVYFSFVVDSSFFFSCHVVGRCDVDCFFVVPTFSR